MTLTVPQSNRAAGRAARLQPVEASALGEAAARLGDVANRVGREIEGEALRHQAQRAQVEYTRELGELRLEVGQIGDPDEMDRVWTARSRDIRDRYVGENSGVDPRLREDLGAGFDQLANNHAFQVGQNAINGRRARQEALWLTYGQDIANQAPKADQETRDTLLSGAWDMLGDLEASGQIDAAERVRRFQALVGEVDNTTAIEMIGQDPQAFLEAQVAGTFDSLGPEVNARYANQAKAAIAAEETAQADAAEKAAKEQDKAIGKRLSEMADIYGKDRVPLDEAFLARPEVKAHPEYGRVMAAKRLAENKIDLMAMPPSAIEEEIARERNRPVVFKYQTEYLDMLEDGLAETEAAWEKDPVTAARERLGQDIPDLPLDGAPGDLAEAVQARLELDREWRAGEFTDERLAILSEDEKAALAERIDVEADPTDRVRLAGVFAAEIASFRAAELKRGRDLGLSETELRQIAERTNISAISDDLTFRHVSGFVATGGSRHVAEDIFRGQQAIDAKTALLPPAKDRMDAAFAEVGALFAYVPGGDAIQAQVVASADALYARRMRITDPVDDIDVDVYQQALHEVMGGTGAYDSRDARGGVQELRGRLTAMPAGIGAEAVEEALMRLGVAERPGARSGTVLAADPAVLSAQLGAISANGQVPAIAGRPLDRGMLSRMTLRAVGADQFVFVFPAAGGEQVLTDTDGGEYRFSLRRLLREVRQ